jgi:hypothetical protein
MILGDTREILNAYCMDFLIDGIFQLNDGVTRRES